MWCRCSSSLVRTASKCTTCRHKQQSDSLGYLRLVSVRPGAMASLPSKLFVSALLNDLSHRKSVDSGPLGGRQQGVGGRSIDAEHIHGWLRWTGRPSLKRSGRKASVGWGWCLPAKPSGKTARLLLIHTQGKYIKRPHSAPGPAPSAARCCLLTPTPLLTGSSVSRASPGGSP